MVSRMGILDRSLTCMFRRRFVCIVRYATGGPDRGFPVRVALPNLRPDWTSPDFLTSKKSHSARDSAVRWHGCVQWLAEKHALGTLEEHSAVPYRHINQDMLIAFAIGANRRSVVEVIRQSMKKSTCSLNGVKVGGMSQGSV